jgi:hypothetical protein
MGMGYHVESMTRQDGPSAPAHFKRCDALALWLFAAFWLAALTAFTYIVIRDGEIPQLGHWGIPLMAAFWFCGIGLARHAARLPCITFTVGRDTVEVRERFPFQSRRSRYASEQVSVDDIAEEKDNDGDINFKFSIRVDGGRRLEPSQSIVRAEVEADRLRFLAALGRSV